MNTQYKKGVLLLSFGVVPTVFVLLHPGLLPEES